MSTELSVRAPRGLARGFDPDTLIDEWQADMQAQADAGELSPLTVSTYRRGMTAFWTWFQAQSTYKSVGPRAIRSWLASMKAAGLGPSGINTPFAGVRSFFRWAVAESGLAYDPTTTVRGVKVGRRRHKRDPLSDDEVVRVLAQPDTQTVKGKRTLAILCLMAYTGVRTIEVARALVGDLRTNGTLRLYVWGKGEAEANEVVYLVHPDVVDAMYAWLAVHPKGGDLKAPLFTGIGGCNLGGPLTTRTIRKLVKAAYHAAGVRDPRKTTHSLRHSLVTNLICHKVPAVRIMTVTRHRSLDTIMVYAHEVDRDSDPAEAYVNYRNGK